MSTFTVTLTVSGSVKGQAITFSTEFDVENVYDVATLNDIESQGLSIGSNASGFVYMNQDCPSMLYMRNDAGSQSGAAWIDGASGTTCIMGLNPGQFILLHEAVQGEGMIISDVGPVIALDEIEEAFVRYFPNWYSSAPNSTIIELFTAAS